MKEKNKIESHILSFVWLMFLIMPNSNIFYFFVPVSFLVLYTFRYKTRIAPIVIILLLSLFITFLININKNYLGFKDYSRFVTLIIFIISFGKLRGSTILKPYITFAVFFLLITQFAYSLNISYIVNLINSYYTNEDTEYKVSIYENFQFFEYGSTRLGGIYFNSNQYAKFLEFILLAILIEIKQFSKIELQVLLPIIILSIVATGSRTSFIVIVLVFLGYLYFNRKLNPRNIFILTILAFTLFGYLFATTNIQEFRLFKIEEGLENSFGIKLYLFQKYIADVSNPLYLFFGNLSTQVLSQEYGFINSSTDFDIGNVTISYGIIFYFLFFLFCYKSYKLMLPKYRIFFIILFWMFSSTIINSYRAAPIYFLMMGLYYKRSILEKYERGN
jgi:hypothetical protein